MITLTMAIYDNFKVSMIKIPKSLPTNVRLGWKYCYVHFMELEPSLQHFIFSVTYE
jgi:hypothetical protein